MKRSPVLLAGILLFVVSGCTAELIPPSSTMLPTPVSTQMWSPWNPSMPISTPVPSVATATLVPTFTPLPTDTPTPRPEPPTSTPEPPTPTPEPPTPTPEPPTPEPAPLVKSFSDEYVQNSLVRVRVYSDEYSYNIGTGVIIRHEGQEYVLTNRHVVEGSDDIRILGRAYGFARPQNIAIAPKHDLAILTPTINERRLDVSDYGLELAAKDDDPPTTAWFALFRNNVADITHIAPATYCDTFTVKGVEDWVYDLTTRPGTSGSPIINSQGQVVSIHWGSVSGRYTCRTAGLDAAKGHRSVTESYSVPIHAIHNLFDEMSEEDTGGGSDD